MDKKFVLVASLLILILFIVVTLQAQQPKNNIGLRSMPHQRQHIKSAL